MKNTDLIDAKSVMSLAHELVDIVENKSLNDAVKIAALKSAASLFEHKFSVESLVASITKALNRE